MEIITSSQNQIYKNTLKLLSKKYRDRENKYIIEGIKIFNDFKDILDISYIIVSEKMKDLEYNGIKYIFSDSLFSNITSQVNSQGVILVCNKRENHLEDINGDVVILDNIQDPGNLGTIIRTLSAFDIKNLIITSDSVDCYSPKVLRATMGTEINLNIYREKKAAIIDFLNDRCYNFIITDLHKDSIDFMEVELNTNNAYIFGNEGVGVSQEFKKNKHIKAIIPINKNTESLNLAISVGIFMYGIKLKRGGLLT